jgi:hypothetical protein
MTRGFVILAALLVALPQLSLAQYESPQVDNQKRDQGPRALALLELSANGTAHIVPVAIMIGDDFFDASIYKADPVPMALDSGTIYEAERSGISQGLFTVKEAVQAGINWSGTGKWQDTAALAAQAARRKKEKEAEEKPPTIADNDSGPPKLLRRSTASAPSSPPPAAPKQEPSKPESSKPGSTPQTTPSSPSAGPSSQSSAPSTADKQNPPSVTSSNPPSDSSEVSDENDPNRPHLERGKPTASQKITTSRSDLNPTPASKLGPTPHGAKGPASTVQEIPAISDASGPEPRSYAFALKPGEADQFRKKMLAQAAQVVRAHLKQELSQPTTHTTGHSAAKSKTATHIPEPSFQDVNLRIFDLSSSNQPIMILEANVQVPGHNDLQHITLIARQDLYGVLHNSLANLTDSKHLDTTPQMDLIDVVDADGDGRGELLFRETSEQGHAYSIYRVIGDQLYQLYQSTPQ